jgi:hypothetical protein
VSCLYLYLWLFFCRKDGRVVRRARNHTVRECGVAKTSVMVDGRVEGGRRVLQAMRYDARVCVGREKQKITRRETYMHKVDRTLQAICKLRGALVARGDSTTKHLD